MQIEKFKALSKGNNLTPTILTEETIVKLEQQQGLTSLTVRKSSTRFKDVIDKTADFKFSTFNRQVVVFVCDEINTKIKTQA